MSPDGEEQGPEPAPVEGLLDLTDEPPGPPPRALVDLRDIEQQREEMRGIIALFSLVMIGALSAVIFEKAPDDIKPILELVLPPGPKYLP